MSSVETIDYLIYYVDHKKGNDQYEVIQESSEPFWEDKEAALNKAQEIALQLGEFDRVEVSAHKATEYKYYDGYEKREIDPIKHDTVFEKGPELWGYA